MKKIIEFFAGMAVIFSVQYLCMFLLKILKISFPAPILGIVVLFILLKTNIIKENLVENFCNFILKYMILFFIPLFVGVIQYKDLIINNFLNLTLILFITTSFVIALVGLMCEYIIKYKRLIRLKRSKR